MTHTTPEPAGFTAGKHDTALFSLKRQTAENFAIGGEKELFEWYSPEQFKAATAERDAYKAELENIANANPRKWDAPCNNAETFLLWAQSRARAAIAKEAK